MAIVTVKRRGKPLYDVLVSAICTFGFGGKYDQKDLRTDRDGQAEFDDNANRFRIYVGNQEATIVDRLAGNIEINLN